MSAPEINEWANYALLYPKGVTAIANNVAYLAAAASPTFPLSVAEQTALVAQVSALTRQVDVMIRVLLGQLDVTDGT